MIKLTLIQILRKYKEFQLVRYFRRAKADAKLKPQAVQYIHSMLHSSL